jgi:hypothetical protein
LKLIEYIVAQETPLPPIQAAMYEYITAANGVFVRGKRTGMEVMLPLITNPLIEVRGLVRVAPFVRLDYPRVYESLMRKMLSAARGAIDSNLNSLKVLFYLGWGSEGWWMTKPPQEQTVTSVQPVGSTAIYKDSLIELHSHHEMPAQFSNIDNADETGFRLYAVLGNIFKWPTLRVRVGLYGHYWEVPATWIFDLPSNIADALAGGR